jgi:glycosyltransferase involved in cell wall biosynthesis
VKILLVSEFMVSVGGVQTHLDALIPRLKERVKDLAIATNYPLEPFPAGVDQTIDRHGVQTWKATDKCKAIAWKPDLVYYHGLADADLEAWYAANFPTVMYAHNYHGTCATGNKCFAHLGYQSCTRRLGPACLLAFLPFGCGGLNLSFLATSYRLQRKRQRNLPLMKHILVAGQHMQSEYLRHGVEPSRLSIVPLFPPGTLPQSEPPSERSFSNRLLVATRLAKVKGVELIPSIVQEATRNLGRKLEVVVAGDGPRMNHLREAVTRVGVQARIEGWISVEERSRWMRESDLLVVPSLWPEPFGLVGIEAGCVGLPAVGFSVGGIRDWLIPSESGELASEGDMSANSLADATVRALRDPAHWHKLRIGAWKMSRRFDLESHLQSLMDIFQDLCPSAARSTNLA